MDKPEIHILASVCSCMFEPTHYCPFNRSGHVDYGHGASGYEYKCAIGGNPIDYKCDDGKWRKMATACPLDCVVLKNGKKIYQPLMWRGNAQEDRKDR